MSPWVENNGRLIGRTINREKYLLWKKNWILSKRRGGGAYVDLFNGSKAFDIDEEYRGCGFLETICDKECSPLVILYAKTGLHSYNLLEGKNLQFRSVKRYNRTTHSAACFYFITQEAMDPLTHSIQTFQTKVVEGSYGKFQLRCPIARPLGETKRINFKRHFNHKAMKSFFRINDVLPEWPPENPFENSKLCHLNKSQLQENDWIRLYLELAVATTNGHCKEDRSNLKILKVAIDTVIDTRDVTIKVAFFYIRYKDSCQARVGNDVDRVAVIRRGFIEGIGYFRLMGRTMSSSVIRPIKKGKKQFLFGLPLKKRLFLSPTQRLKACKYNGVGLSGKKRRSAQLSPSPRQPKACKYNGVPNQPLL